MGGEERSVQPGVTGGGGRGEGGRGGWGGGVGRRGDFVGILRKFGTFFLGLGLALRRRDRLS